MASINGDLLQNYYPRVGPRNATMNGNPYPVTILMAEDDEDDRLLAQEAFEECNLHSQLQFVKDGEELLDYLHRRGQFSHLESWVRPSLILLDLNMPKKDGREALKEIKDDPKFCYIPIVILTTSKAEEDICRTYELGANSYVTKPVSFESLVQMMETLGKYWLETVELPEFG